MFSIQSQSNSFFCNFGQIWSKITQPRTQNENLTFLGQNISLWGKHTKNLEFQCLSSKKWFLELDSRVGLILLFENFENCSSPT